MIDLAHAAAVLWVGIALCVLVGVFATLTAAGPDSAAHNEMDST